MAEIDRRAGYIHGSDCEESGRWAQRHRGGAELGHCGDPHISRGRGCGAASIHPNAQHNVSKATDWLGKQGLGDKTPVNERGGAYWGEQAPPQQRRIGGNHLALLVKLSLDSCECTP